MSTRRTAALAARRQRTAVRSAASTPRFTAGGYTGARGDLRELQEWSPGANTADQDTLPSREQLVARSADLVRNDALAAGALNTQTTKVLGVGLFPQPRLDRDYLGLSQEQARAFEVQMLRIWWAVAGTTSLDLTDSVTFRGLTEQVLRGTLERGDLVALRRYVPRPGQLLGLKLELLEGDRLCNPKDGQDTPTRRAGIDYDAYGVATRYWIKSPDLSTAPFGYTLSSLATWTSVAARGAESGERQVLHLLDKKRPGQSRGVPYLAPVILALKQLSRYSQAELMAAVISSAFTVFVKTLNGEGLAPGPAVPTVGVVDPLAAAPPLPPRIDIGAIVPLQPGEEIDIANPGRPNDKFQPFFLAICQQIGVALEIPAEILLKKFDASYTAARAALLELWEAILVRRNWLVESWCQPVYEWVMGEAVSRELLAAPGYFDDPLARRAYCAAEWTGPKQGQLDPYKEILAAKERVALTVSTLQRETGEMTGADWDETVAQRAHERAELARLGVPDAATAALGAPPALPDGSLLDDPNAPPPAPVSPADASYLAGAAV